MKKIIAVAMVSSLVMLVACGGREPEPVMVTRPGDEQKSCDVLIYDIENIEFQIYKLLPQTEGKTLKNVGYGVAGYFTFFIPWLMMDFKNAEAKEYEALRQRYDHLAMIAVDKGCNVTPKKYPSKEDIKEDYEKQKATQPPQPLTTGSEVN